jgi:hypothetical protein
MTVKEAKKYLDRYDDNDEITIAWWDKDMAPYDTEEIPWEEQVSILDNKMDWSGTHEDMRICIDSYWSDE